MIKDILVLRITKISQHVLGVAGKLLEVEQLIETELFNKPGFILFPHLKFNFMSKHLISVSIILIDGQLRFIRVREHVSGYGYPILYGMADPKCE